ncbi:MAG: thioredoxin family protein, partial [Oscillospiraceae bacterium]|nr:thioredoxin family protein [Oscillospiraceae bacterium]
IAAERSDIKVVKAEVDENRELARKFRVMSVPTLLVIKNGETVARSMGVQSKEKILSMI